MKTDGSPDRQPHRAEYLDTAGAVSQWMRTIGGSKLVALDTEGASFHRFIDRIYLLQVSTREHTAVIDPLPIGTPGELGALIEDPSVEIVFHDADYDLRLLQQDYGWQVRNVFDTRVAAQLLGIKAFGLAALLEQFFGVKLDKKHQRADWSMRPLTGGMLEYAAQDTMYLPALRDELKALLEQKGRWAWAQEEFTRLEATKWAAEDESAAFMKMKGARDLSRRELAILRELVAWRNEVAGQQDKATFRVLGNEPLFEIAKTAPRSREALATIKGMPRGMIESRTQGLLDAVTRGLAVPDADLPKYPRGPRWDRDPDFDTRVTAIKTARDLIAAKLDMDTGVLFSRERMEAVARANPKSVDEVAAIPGLRRWQVDVFGQPFVDALKPHQKPEPSPYKD